MTRISHSSLVCSATRGAIPNSKKPDGIHSIFILRESGCPFYYRNYSPRCDEPDPAILGGFFIALSLFAKEITLGQLETVTTSPCRFTFHPLRRGLLVLRSSKEVSPIIIEKIAKRIAKLFTTKFNGRLLKPQPASETAPNLAAHIDQIFWEIMPQSSAVSA